MGKIKGKNWQGNPRKTGLYSARFEIGWRENINDSKAAECRAWMLMRLMDEHSEFMPSECWSINGDYWME